MIDLLVVCVLNAEVVPVTNVDLQRRIGFFGIFTFLVRFLTALYQAEPWLSCGGGWRYSSV